MADFSAVRDGLKTLLDAIDGLTVHATAPDTITGPTIVITPSGEGTFIQYDAAMDGDAEDMEFTLHLFVPRRHDVTAQGELDGYLDKTGDLSVFAAIAASAVTGGQYAAVERAHDYGDYEYPPGGDKFLGCKFAVTVGAV